MTARRGLLALTISAALAAGALGGCGSDDEASDSGEAATESESAEQTTTQPSGGAAY